ncbi:hypothetical protein ACGF12_22595 [Kitasatospora sp. NPDC048296]|uniref:hypothetical protein n=1 Tax=Kitasatospora sp. NPDC048296 TaxID=3364048 RepID=UPI0037205B3F
MGMGPTARLVYGYALGGDGDGWKVNQLDSYGALSVDWFNSEDKDFAEAATTRLLASIVGFTETDWQIEGYFGRKQDAEDLLGIEIVVNGSCEYPRYCLAMKVCSVEWGETEAFDFVALTAQAASEGWSDRLRKAMDTLGLTTDQSRSPQWILTAYYG